MLKETYFWFLQPSSALNNFDWIFIYIFAGMFAAGILFLLGLLFVKHQVYSQALKRWQKMFMYLGLSGLIWAGFRYENTPIFAKRFWVGLIFLIGLVWLFYILKYTIFKLSKDKAEYENALVKSKYMPKAKK